MRVDQDGVTYEADPRHTDLLLSSLNMADCTGAATPGVKPLDRDEHAIKLDESSQALLEMDPDNAIAATCRGPAECAKSFFTDSDHTNNCDAYFSGCPDGVRDSAGVHEYSTANVTANANGLSSQIASYS